MLIFAGGAQIRARICAPVHVYAGGGGGGGSNTLLHRPPSSTTNFYNTLELTLDKIAERNVILVGDFNAEHRDWFSGDATNSHGATLKDLMSRFDMVQTCSEPTHLNNDGVPESLLDLVFTNSPNFVNATRFTYNQLFRSLAGLSSVFFL